MKPVLIDDGQSTIRRMIRLALREHFAVDEADRGMIGKRRATTSARHYKMVPMHHHPT